MRSCTRRILHIFATALVLGYSAAISAADGATEAPPASAPREARPADN